MRSVFIGLVFAFFVAVSASCVAAQGGQEGPTVRIGILVKTDKVRIKVRGHYSMIDLSNQSVIRTGRRTFSGTLAFHNNSLFFDNTRLEASTLRIVTKKSIAIEVNGQLKNYRGIIDVLGKDGNKMSVINRINLEDYIRGVLYHEVTDRWPMEALKAQAVAARTYSIYRINHYATADYDVTSDIYSQVYGGRSAERYRTNLAVKRTKGQILTFQDDVLPAYYHAACGGMTEDVDQVWGNQLIQPLKGKICIYCQGSPYSKWKKEFQLKKIQEKLIAAGYDIWLIKEIAVRQFTPTGRVKELEITTRDNKTIAISGKKFRNIIGPNNLKSNKYRIVMKGYYCDFYGSGWGHGVGLCQWGSKEMASRRFNYKEILQYYYPGSEIKSLSGKYFSSHGQE